MATTDQNKSWIKTLGHFWPLYLMLLPAVVYYILICYVPMGGILMAFQDFNFRRGILGSKWIGFQYFITFFTSYDFPRLLRNTLTIGFIKCIIEFPFPIILALMLNEVKSQGFKRVNQTISYMPYFMSDVIIVTMLQRLLAPNIGILNSLIASLGGDPSTFFMMEAKYFYQLLFSMDIWKGIGYSSIIYLAAISGVDSELYEAAEIDGCGKIKKIWHVTLPGIAGTIGILFILSVGGLISSSYSQILLLRTPGNMALADTLDLFVVRVGLQNGQFGYATAVGLVQGLVGLCLVVAANKISRKYAEISVW
ncbi:MAG: ABC transporter permease subunit [Treponema sp.]|jgi:putative aldouronate transport system permease protein|nr:ABC transporter permease subunit [Treponema sp.]